MWDKLRLRLYWYEKQYSSLIPVFFLGGVMMGWATFLQDKLWETLFGALFTVLCFCGTYIYLKDIVKYNRLVDQGIRKLEEAGQLPEVMEILRHGKRYFWGGLRLGERGLVCSYRPQIILYSDILMLERHVSGHKKTKRDHLGVLVRGSQSITLCNTTGLRSLFWKRAEADLLTRIKRFWPSASVSKITVVVRERLYGEFDRSYRFF